MELSSNLDFPVENKHRLRLQLSQVWELGKKKKKKEKNKKNK